MVSAISRPGGAQSFLKIDLFAQLSTAALNADAGHRRFIVCASAFKEIPSAQISPISPTRHREKGRRPRRGRPKIFTGLKCFQGSAVPVVVRFDYHGSVPNQGEGARLAMPPYRPSAIEVPANAPSCLNQGLCCTPSDTARPRTNSPR